MEKVNADKIPKRTLAAMATSRGDKQHVIGKRNVLAIKKILWAMGAGSHGRGYLRQYRPDVSILAKTGEVLVTSPSREPMNL